MPTFRNEQSLFNLFLLHAAHTCKGEARKPGEHWVGGAWDFKIYELCMPAKIASIAIYFDRREGRLQHMWRKGLQCGNHSVNSSHINVILALLQCMASLQRWTGNASESHAEPSKAEWRHRSAQPHKYSGQNFNSWIYNLIFPSMQFQHTYMYLICVAVSQVLILQATDALFSLLV